MSKQTVTVRKRVKKGEVPEGYHICKSCSGRGYKANKGPKPK